MSSGGSLHKKDWLKLGLAAAAAGTGAGAMGIGPLAGLFGASSIAPGVAAGLETATGAGAAAGDAFLPAALGAGGDAGVANAVYGATGAGAAAGDAYLPGALGSNGAGGSSVNSLMRGALGSKTAGNIAKGMYYGGLLSQPQGPPAGMASHPMTQGTAPTPTVLYPHQASLGGGGSDNDPNELLKRWLMLQQGGTA